jgi:beta-glucanase (GH16 family)
MPSLNSASSRTDFDRTQHFPILVLFLFLITLSSCAGGQTATAPPNSGGTGTYTLTWSDEFSSPDGSSPDSSKWTMDIGGNGWGNNELEYYTSRPQNVQIVNGNLSITALNETYTGTDGVTRQYTSARLKTAGRFTQRYGRFEARIKLPKGQGLWAAFWMLGDNYTSVGWPQCGEIDIMENIGSNPSTILGTLHGPGYSGSAGLTANYSLPSPQLFSDDFHLFAVEWEPTAIRFYVDGVLYKTRTPADLPAGTQWVFDHPFYIILNLAVGGNLPGAPDATTQFPQSMLVDYVRVYELK